MEGVRALIKRMQMCSLIVVVLAAGIVVPLAIDHSNSKRVHLPTAITSYLAFLLGLCLRGLVSEEFLDTNIGRRRYVAVKVLLHACAAVLLALSFSVSLMMRMNTIATALTLAVAEAFVAHRLWHCVAAPLDTDLLAYAGCDDDVHRLLETCSGVTSIVFGGWYGMAAFYFQDYPDAVREARFRPPEYLTFFTAIAASLVLVKAVPRRLATSQRPATELVALACGLACGVMATAVAIAASRVRGYAVLVFFPEGVALAAWCAQRSQLLPVTWPPHCLGQGHGAGEPASYRAFVSVSLTLLLAVLGYGVKDAQALSTPFERIFVFVTATAVVAALGWSVITMPPVLRRAPGVQPAANILAFFTFWLLLLSVLSCPSSALSWVTVDDYLIAVL